MYDEPCMQWGAEVSVLASWGEGSLVPSLSPQERLGTRLGGGAQSQGGW